jgi:hypothetical protein
MGGKMNHTDWNWAQLNLDQLEKLKQEEESLGVDYLLAYQEDENADARMLEAFRSGLQTAELDQDQIQHLEGLESDLGAVVIAYKNA